MCFWQGSLLIAWEHIQRWTLLTGGFGMGERHYHWVWAQVSDRMLDVLGNWLVLVGFQQLHMLRTPVATFIFYHHFSSASCGQSMSFHGDFYMSNQSFPSEVQVKYCPGERRQDSAPSTMTSSSFQCMRKPWVTGFSSSWIFPAFRSLEVRMMKADLSSREFRLPVMPFTVPRSFHSGIYILDSVGNNQHGNSGHTFNLIMGYLGSKAKELGLSFSKRNWNHLNVMVSFPVIYYLNYLLLLILQVPQQANDADCGYYLLQFAESFLSSPEALRGVILVNVWYPLFGCCFDSWLHLLGQNKCAKKMGSSNEYEKQAAAIHWEWNCEVLEWLGQDNMSLHTLFVYIVCSKISHWLRMGEKICPSNRLRIARQRQRRSNLLEARAHQRGSIEIFLLISQIILVHIGREHG